jgi:hypothetical protein
MNVSVHHWRHEDGLVKQQTQAASWVNLDPVPAGWYCWCYPSNDREFETWMEQMCPTADVTHRFNSGDPMYTVCITNAEEAMLFRITWM